MHPQLAATLLGRPLPPQPGESGATFEPERLPLVQPRTGDEAAECQHVWVAYIDGTKTRLECCAGCGRVNDLRVSVNSEKHGALTAVAGRMFRR